MATLRIRASEKTGLDLRQALQRLDFEQRQTQAAENAGKRQAEEGAQSAFLQEAHIVLLALSAAQAFNDTGLI